jgi:hypothetical protein
VENLRIIKGKILFPKLTLLFLIAARAIAIKPAPNITYISLMPIKHRRSAITPSIPNSTDFKDFFPRG